MPGWVRIEPHHLCVCAPNSLLVTLLRPADPPAVIRWAAAACSVRRAGAAVPHGYGHQAACEAAERVQGAVGASRRLLWVCKATPPGAMPKRLCRWTRRPSRRSPAVSPSGEMDCDSKSPAPTAQTLRRDRHLNVPCLHSGSDGTAKTTLRQREPCVSTNRYLQAQVAPNAVPWMFLDRAYDPAFGVVRGVKVSLQHRHWCPGGT